MALKDIKARIAARMKTVSGVTNVYTYRRNLTAEIDMAQLTAADGGLQAINADRRAGPGGTKLNGFVQTADPPELRGPFNFAEVGMHKVLCHHAEIAMKVTPRYLQ